MDILFIAPRTDINGRKGDSIHLREIIQNLSQTNRVTLLSSSQKIFEIKKENKLLMRNIWQPNLRFLAPIITWLFAFTIGFKILVNTKPDVIYERHHICGIGCWLGKIFDIPCVTEVNGLVTREHLNFGRVGIITAKIMKMIEKTVFSIADKVVVVNIRIMSHLIQEFNISPDKITVVENGVNTELFRPYPTENKKLRFKQGEFFHVGFAGSLSPWCGLTNLVKSAPFITDIIKNVKFIIVGDGPEREKIETMAKDCNVEKYFSFIGRIAYQQVPNSINEFDIGIALKEKNIPGSPLKLREYMSCGIPIVASNSKDFNVLKDYNIGILVDPEKPEEVANVIVSLLRDKKLRREMGENGRKYVVKNHSWKNVAKKVEKVCIDVTELKEKVIDNL